MIDIHTHILPNVDDGPTTLEESLDMARAAEVEGIHTIIATPHHRNGAFDNPGDEIKARVQELNHHIKAEGINVDILHGQETRINGDMVQDLKAGNVIPLHHTYYVLVEFSSVEVPHYTRQLLYDLQLEGYIPVIVHPERNKTFVHHPDKLQSLVEKGALTQLTAAAVTGEQGKKVKQFCEQLIDADLAHLVSSDAHNVSSRRFHLRQSYEKITQTHGEDEAQQWQENARLLVQNKPIIAGPPQYPKRKKKFGIF